MALNKNAPRVDSSRGIDYRLTTSRQEGEECAPAIGRVDPPEKCAAHADQQQHTQANGNRQRVDGSLFRCNRGNWTCGNAPSIIRRGRRGSSNWSGSRWNCGSTRGNNGRTRIEGGRIEDQYNLLTKRNYFTRLQHARTRQALAINKRPVGRAEILQNIFPALKGETRVSARNFSIVDYDPVG